MLYTSHYLEEVEALCSRVAILDDGKVAACQDVKTLLDTGPARIRIEVVGDPVRGTELIPKGVEWQVFGQEVSIPLDDSVVVLSALQAGAIKIATIRSEKVDLESVFLRLTGHALRDEGL